MSMLDALRAVVTDPDLFEVADAIPAGRRRQANWVYLTFGCGAATCGSQRRAAAILSSSSVIELLDSALEDAFPDDPARRWPQQPVTRDQYRGFQKAAELRWQQLQDRLRSLAVRQARARGLSTKPSSPSPVGLLRADGRTVSPIASKAGGHA